MTAPRPDVRRSRNARLALGATVVLVALAGWSAGGAVFEPVSAIAAEGAAEQIRHGTEVYPALASSWQVTGIAPAAWAVTLPLLPLAAAHLPAWAIGALLYGLAAAVAFLWSLRVPAILGRRGLGVTAGVLLAAGMAGYLSPATLVFPEAWAGLLVSLALAIRRGGHWVEAAAVGLVAAVLAPIALGVLAAMGITALVDRARAEAAGWLVAILAASAVLVAHVHGIGDLLPEHEAAALPVPPLLTAIAQPTILGWLAAPLAAILAALALVGWGRSGEPAGPRLLLATLFCWLLARAGLSPDPWAWAFVVAAPMPLGLAFAARDLPRLARAALDRRRITVTRVRR